MSNLFELVDYLIGKPLIYKPQNLEILDRRTCHILRNNLVQSSDISSHPEYRNQSDVIKGVYSALKGMRDDLYPIFIVRHNELEILGGVLFSDVVENLNEYDFDTYEGCEGFLIELGQLLYASHYEYTENNGEGCSYELREGELELLETLLYLTVIGANHLHWANSGTQVLEGVDVEFGKATKR